MALMLVLQMWRAVVGQYTTAAYHWIEAMYLWRAALKMPVMFVQLLVMVRHFYLVVSFAANLSLAYSMKRWERFSSLDYSSA